MMHFINGLSLGVWWKIQFGFTASLVLWQLLKREEFPRGLMLWFWRGTGGILEDRISPVTDRWCKTLQLWQRSVISSHVASVPASHCEKRVKKYIYPTGSSQKLRTTSEDTKQDIRGKEGTGTSQGSVQHMQIHGWGLQETSEERHPSGEEGEKGITGFLSPPCLE